MVKLAQIGNATPYHGHTEWSTDLLELGPDPKRRHRRPLPNASKNAPFRCRMRKLWPKQGRRVCWIWGRRDSWVGDELQLGEDHGVGVSSVAMSSSSSPSRIVVVLDSILAMSSSQRSVRDASASAASAYSTPRAWPPQPRLDRGHPCRPARPQGVCTGVL
jgi:hypothetical protein